MIILQGKLCLACYTIIFAVEEGGYVCADHSTTYKPQKVIPTNEEAMTFYALRKRSLEKDFNIPIL